MSTSHAALVICMFLLASFSHLQAARVFARNEYRAHYKKGSIFLSSATGNSSPCLHGAQLLALSPPANGPADMACNIGHGRALWSTPSDGVGH